MSRCVETKYGRLEGVRSGIQKITVFRGVPYAKPPVGALRWHAPVEMEKWDGVRECSRFAPAAIQTEHPRGSFYEVEFYQGGVDMSEDCLYLNVWADLAKTGQPVMVWFHGGAYMHGFGHEMEFDGDAMAKRGAILVTVNYRVGVLGYMAHPALTAMDGHSGNYGLMDQIFALKWVKENIVAFGGDPENVTIFGQSAGGGSVQSIMTSPLARGLFRRAIIQSAGSPLKSLGGESALSEAEKTGLEMERLAGCGLDGLYAMGAPELLRLGREMMAGGKGLRFRPCVDGYALTEDPGKVFIQGRAMDESLMLGSVTGDAGLFCGGEENQDELAESAIAALAKSRIRLGKPGCYAYHFKRDIPGDDHPGAFHSSELWYVFGTLARSNRPFSGYDYALSLRMIDWWVNFARTGEPGDGWTAFTAQSPAINEIGEGVEMTDISARTLADHLSDEIIESIYG